MLMLRRCSRKSISTTTLFCNSRWIIEIKIHTYIIYVLIKIKSSTKIWRLKAFILDCQKQTLPEMPLQSFHEQAHRFMAAILTLILLMMTVASPIHSECIVRAIFLFFFLQLAAIIISFCVKKSWPILECIWYHGIIGIRFSENLYNVKYNCKGRRNEISLAKFLLPLVAYSLSLNEKCKRSLPNYINLGGRWGGRWLQSERLLRKRWLSRGTTQCESSLLLVGIHLFFSKCSTDR